jgi:hypothetical protein
MPTPIEKARKRLAEVLAEAEEIRRFIDLYERFSDDSGSGLLQRPVINSQETYPQELKAVDSGDNSPRRSGPTPRELTSMMERIIREVGRPMTRGEIVEALARRDVEILAKDKQRYIGTLAWRNKGTFVNIDGLGYWLRNVMLVTRTPVTPEAFSDPSEAEGQEGLFTN